MRYDCLGDALGCKVCSRFVVRQPGDFFVCSFSKCLHFSLHFAFFSFYYVFS